MSAERKENYNHCMLKVHNSSDRGSFFPSTPRPEIATLSSSSQQMQHQGGIIKTVSQESTMDSHSQIASSTEEVSSYKATTMKDFQWIGPICDELLGASDEDEDQDSRNGDHRGGEATYPLGEELYILSPSRWSSSEKPPSFEPTPSSLQTAGPDKKKEQAKKSIMTATPSSPFGLSRRLCNSLMQEMGLKQAARKNRHKSQEEMIMNELTRSDSLDRIHGGKRRKVKTLRSRRANLQKQQQYFAPTETSPDILIKMIYEDEIRRHDSTNDQH